MKVLITGINGDIGAGMSLIIREMYPKAYILGVDMRISDMQENAANDINEIHRADHKEFITEFVKLCSGFDIIIPSVEAELSVLSQSNKMVQLPVIKLPNRWLSIFLSKSLTSWWLQDNNLPSPKTTLLADSSFDDLPVIIKPDIGQGSKNILIVDTEKDLILQQRKLVDLNMVAQKVVGDLSSEYTCAVIRFDSQIRTFIMLRELSQGATKSIELHENMEIKRVLEKLATVMDLQGVINVQLRLTNSGPQIFEINPRFSGTLVMRHYLGFQDLYWYIEKMINGTRLPDCTFPVGAKVERIDGWHEYIVKLPQ